MFQSDFFTPDSVPPVERLPVTIGRRITACLADGRHLVRSDIAGFFAEQSGDEAPGTHWSIADYNDAIEIGTILWLRDRGRIDLATGFPDAEARFEWLDAALPPRHVRSERQVALQQFSGACSTIWRASVDSEASPDGKRIDERTPVDLTTDHAQPLSAENVQSFVDALGSRTAWPEAGHPDGDPYFASSLNS